jgi:predicted ThiF/HesA family dinucleotide-utilizing enzyme
MKRLKLNRKRQECFLRALAGTGNVTTAVAVAGTSRSRVYELRKTNGAFAAGWDEAEEIAADRLEEEARRRAVEGVQEPLVSGGKIVRDDDGQPIAIRRYADTLLLALLKAHRPEKFRDQKLIHAGDPQNPIEHNVSLMTPEQRVNRALELVAKARQLSPPSDDA